MKILHSLHNCESEVVGVEASDQTVDLVRPKRGRPKKTWIRGRGRPRGSKNKLPRTTSRESSQLELMHMDWHSEAGILARARRAYIRSQHAGIVFQCSEDEAIQGIASKIRR